MDSGGQQSSKQGSVYSGVSRVLPGAAPTSDKVFGSTMPNAQGDTTPSNVSSGQIYGNQNYVNPNLQGYSQAGNNIVNVEQLNNKVAPMTPQAVEQMRRGDLTNQAASQPSQLPPQSQPAAQPLPNINYVQQPPATTNIAPNTAPNINYSNNSYGSINQHYAQPSPLPQMSQRQGNGQPIYNGGQLVRQGSTYHDLSTAEGNLDYLNAIAPDMSQSKSNLLSNKLFVGLGIGAIILVIVISAIGALGNSGGNFNKKALALGTALANLEGVAAYGKDNAGFTSYDVRAVTAETRLVMASHQTALSSLMTLAVNNKGKATDAKADPTVTENLDKAKASGNLDSAYRTQLKTGLSDVATAAEQAYNTTKNTKIKQALSATYTDLQTLLDRLSRAQSDQGGQAAD